MATTIPMPIANLTALADSMVPHYGEPGKGVTIRPSGGRPAYASGAMLSALWRVLANAQPSADISS
jgi:hypothetical protein